MCVMDHLPMRTGVATAKGDAWRTVSDLKYGSVARTFPPAEAAMCLA